MNNTEETRRKIRIQSILSWQKKNPAKLKEYQRISRERNKDKIRLKRIEWLKNNRDVINLQQRNWRQKNKERIRIYGINYKFNHPFRVKYNKYKYSSKKRGYEFAISYEQFSKILINSSCQYCGSKDSIGLDRIINNIGYTINNIVPCCWSCNKLKSSFSKEKFINICIAVANNNKYVGM